MEAQTEKIQEMYNKDLGDLKKFKQITRESP